MITKKKTIVKTVSELTDAFNYSLYNRG